ncbi:MAG TPA: hypothetical protein VK046_05135 [Actinomycetaceae bacterium]|nr:hypothetical protein [Actinomycetaceae bacterium]
MTIFAVLADAPPSPPPTPEEFTIYTVTPGISGFIAFFVLALIGWLLFRSLVRHMRKVDMAAAARESAEQESDGAEGDGAEGTDDAASASDPAVAAPAGGEPATGQAGPPAADEHTDQQTGSGTAIAPDTERPR